MDQLIAGARSLIAERIAYAAAHGLSPRVGATYRLPDAPWRKVWHTMEAPEDDPDTVPDEGWELEQIVRHAIEHRTPPHLWALPLHDVVLQTVPLDLASYALRHNSGDPETNHAHAIQTEVIGFARDGLTDPGLCDWLGERILGPVLRAGVPIAPTFIAPSTGSDGYGEDGAVRMTWSEWATFNGQCGHANVPGNEHWDPGVADYERIARAGVTAVTPVTPVTPEEIVMFIADCKGKPALLFAGPGSVKKLSVAQRNALRRRDVPAKLVSVEDWDALWSLR